MEAHEWMVRSTYQTEWIKDRGIFLWLAMYAGGLGGGLYLVSLYFDSLLGMLVSLVIVAGLKGSFHFAYLGKPLRFWRVMLRPRTSWLARGFWFVLLFVIFVAVQITLSFFAPGTGWEVLLKILAGLMAVGLMVYTGFVLNSVKAVSLWNSSLVPVLFITWGLMGGFGASILVALYDRAIDIHTAETGTCWLLVINALLVTLYLYTTAHRDETGRKSVIAHGYGVRRSRTRRSCWNMPNSAKSRVAAMRCSRAAPCRSV